MANVSVDGLADAIIGELNQYSNEVAKEVKNAVHEVAKECQQEIKNKSPKRSGKYKRGWKIKKAYDKPDDTRLIVHNATDYQLTHLLEHGHAKTGGGRVAGTPHIAPAEQNAIKKLEKKVREIVKR